MVATKTAVLFAVTALSIGSTVAAPKGGHRSKGPSRADNIIKAAGVGVDAVNAGANVISAVKSGQQPAQRRSPKGGRISGKTFGHIIDGAGVAVDAVNAGVNVAQAVKGQKREPM